MFDVDVFERATSCTLQSLERVHSLALAELPDAEATRPLRLGVYL